MIASLFCQPANIRSRRDIAAACLREARRAAHERACELVAASAPRLRRVRGYWETRGGDGVWRRA